MYVDKVHIDNVYAQAAKETNEDPAEMAVKEAARKAATSTWLGRRTARHI